MGVATGAIEKEERMFVATMEAPTTRFGKKNKKKMMKKEQKKICSMHL